MVMNNKFTFELANRPWAIFIDGGSNCHVVGNHIQGASIGIELEGQNCTANNNWIKVTEDNASNRGIVVGATENQVNGNYIIGPGVSTANIGIQVEAGFDEVQINNNYIRNWATGIEVNATTNDNTMIMGNYTNTCTTEITDNGTGTFSSHDPTATTAQNLNYSA
jgi:parallel beta-helix repeat protein